jgi:hypothetical protein
VHLYENNNLNGFETKFFSAVLGQPARRFFESKILQKLFSEKNSKFDAIHGKSYFFNLLPRETVQKKPFYGSFTCFWTCQLLLCRIESYCKLAYLYRYFYYPVASTILAQHWLCRRYTYSSTWWVGGRGGGIRSDIFDVFLLPRYLSNFCKSQNCSILNADSEKV